MADETITVPRRWVEEVCSALDSATIIGMRSCRTGDGLHYGNHDRLIREALGFDTPVLYISDKSLPERRNDG